jgi:hypothetical protein
MTVRPIRLLAQHGADGDRHYAPRSYLCSTEPAAAGTSPTVSRRRVLMEVSLFKDWQWSTCPHPVPEDDAQLGGELTHQLRYARPAAR